jgi:hypothetical protein
LRGGSSRKRQVQEHGGVTLSKSHPRSVDFFGQTIGWAVGAVLQKQERLSYRRRELNKHTVQLSRLCAAYRFSAVYDRLLVSALLSLCACVRPLGFLLAAGRERRNGQGVFENTLKMGRHLHGATSGSLSTLPADVAVSRRTMRPRQILLALLLAAVAVAVISGAWRKLQEVAVPHVSDELIQLHECAVRINLHC